MFDVRRNCLHNLAPKGGTDVLIGGRTVAWTFQTDSGERRWQLARRRS